MSKEADRKAANDWADRASKLLDIALKAVRDGDADAALLALKEGSESGARVLKQRTGVIALPDLTQEKKS